MNYKLITASAFVFTFARVGIASAQTLISYLPNELLTAGISANNFRGQALFPSNATSNASSLISPSCNYHLDMQTDGNLVVYAGAGTGSPLWATSTNNTNTDCGPGIDCFYAILKPNGSFEVDDALSINNMWTASNSPNNVFAEITLQDNGDLHDYSPNNSDIWDSGPTGSTPSQLPCSSVSSPWTEINNYVVEGNLLESLDIGTNPVGSVTEACGIICNQTDGCAAFDFGDGGLYHCRLFSTITGLASNSGKAAGFREPGAFRIQNRWMSNEYMQPNGSVMQYGAMSSSGSQIWNLVPRSTGFYALMNAQTGDVISLQDQLAYAEYLPYVSTQWSSQWTLVTPVSGYVQFVNRWTNDLLFVEDQNGDVERGPGNPLWWSSQWVLAH
jgi:hypothetical protein